MPLRFTALIATIVSGAVLAFLSYKLWSLDTQYIIAIVAATLLASLSMIFLPRYSDFLLVAMLCSIPFSSFNKSFFLNSWQHAASAKSAMRFSGVISIALPDILLAALYFIWALKVVALRTATIPRPQKSDLFPMLLVLAYVCSIPGSAYPTAAIFGLFYLLRCVLYYIYLSRHIEMRHFPWFLLALCFAIIPEFVLGAIQYATGKWLSLAWARGSGGNLYEQYVVPGIEHIKRATGTLFDSHSYGIYLAMMTGFPFVMVLRRYAAPISRIFWGFIFVLAIMANVLSFSRSAWLSVAISLIILWGIHLMWGQKQILLPSALFVLCMLVLSPFYAPLIYERVSSAGSKIMTGRFDQFPVAWDMWKDHFMFGVGVGNYMDLLKKYNRPGVLELPVHNAFLWVGAESGILGVIAFFGTLFAAMARCWRVVARHREPTCILALAVFGALVAYFIDGLTDPLFREPTVYTMYWVCIGLSVAVSRSDARLRDGSVKSARLDEDTNRVQKASASGPNARFGVVP
jgi:O-antigen ligase